MCARYRLLFLPGDNHCKCVRVKWMPLFVGGGVALRCSMFPPLCWCSRSVGLLFVLLRCCACQCLKDLIACLRTLLVLLTGTLGVPLTLLGVLTRYLCVPNPACIDEACLTSCVGRFSEGYIPFLNLALFLSLSINRSMCIYLSGNVSRELALLFPHHHPLRATLLMRCSFGPHLSQPRTVGNAKLSTRAAQACSRVPEVGVAVVAKLCASPLCL
jgi:hypothetical protein